MQLLSGLMAQIFRVVQEQKSLMKCVNKALESCGITTRKRSRKKLQLPKLLKQLKVRHYRHPNSRLKVLWVISTGGFSLSRAQSNRQSSYYISVFALNWADTSRDPLHGNSALVIRWKSFPGHGRRQSRQSLKGRHVVRRCPISGTQGCYLG